MPHGEFRGRWSREHWMLASLFATLGVLVAAIVPGFDNALREPQAHLVHTTQALALPPLPKRTRTSAAVDSWRIVRVEPGQTLGALFSQLDLPTATMYRLLEHPGMKAPLTRLHAGDELAFDLPRPGQLRALRFDQDDGKRVVLQLDGDRVRTQVIERPVERRVNIVSGEITSSLYAAGAKAGLGVATINQMANAFSFDIDFAHDLRDGDRFNVVYEELWRDGERVGGGHMLAASFVNEGTRYSAFGYEATPGKVEYFDAEGRPLKKAIMRMPVEFSRISSVFTSGRRHPILGRMRAHKGVDFAAGSGTPIMAAGDARVSFVGWKSGYGRAVILDHGRGVTTLYGHMSRFGKYKTGQHVTQGNTIGYVGMTGLATGPHLHYEFRLNGVHRDPLKVTMPKPEPLRGAALATFRLKTAPAVAQLQLVEGPRFAKAGGTTVASAH